MAPDDCADSPSSLIKYAIGKTYTSDYNMIVCAFFEKGMYNITKLEDIDKAPPCSAPQTISFIDSCIYLPETKCVFPTRIVIDFQNMHDDSYTDIHECIINKFDDVVPLIKHLEIDYKKNKYSHIYNITANILDTHNHRWVTLKKMIE